MSYTPQTKEERIVALKEKWRNFHRDKNFEEPWEVPLLPTWEKQEMEELVWPKLIQYGAIPKDKLIIGSTYLGECRNASKAIWKENGKFEYQRTKFGWTFPEEINHFQDDDGYDVFVPIKDLGMV